MRQLKVFAGSAVDRNLGSSQIVLLKGVVRPVGRMCHRQGGEAYGRMALVIGEHLRASSFRVGGTVAANVVRMIPMFSPQESTMGWTLRVDLEREEGMKL